MLKLLLLLLLFLGMYLLQALLYAKYGMQCVAYRCYFDREEVTEGESLLLIEEIENTGLLPLPWVKSEYSVSRFLDFAGTHSVVTDQTRFVSSLFYLRSRSRMQRRWHVTALRRGEYSVEKVLLISSDLLGTARSSRSAEDLGGVLTVLPKYHEGMPPLLSVQSTAWGELPVRYSLLTDPMTFAESYPYTGQEAVRRIDWKTSARTGILTARREEPVQHDRLCICFTVQTGEYGRRYTGEEAAEHTIRVLAALFRECLDRGQVFQVQSNCKVHGEILTTQPDCSPAGHHHLLQMLAALETEPEEQLRECVQIPANARLILAAPYPTEDIRRLKAKYPGADLILTTPCDAGELDFIPVYEEAELHDEN